MSIDAETLIYLFNHLLNLNCNGGEFVAIRFVWAVGDGRDWTVRQERRPFGLD